jgi:hypothetical protein
MRTFNHPDLHRQILPLAACSGRLEEVVEGLRCFSKKVLLLTVVENRQTLCPFAWESVRKQQSGLTLPVLSSFSECLILWNTTADS